MTDTIATLFSGFEGVGVGARAVGIDHLWGVEWSAPLASVAERNDFTTIVGDVRAVDYTTLPRPRRLHASPVCKNASVAKSGSGPSDWAHWMACQRAARKRHPNGIYVEKWNSKRMRLIRVRLSPFVIGRQWYERSGGKYRSDGISEYPEDLHTAQAVCRAIVALQPEIFTLENVRGYRSFAAYGAILDTLRANGYGVAEAVLNSADYGVPQTRERLIVRAVKGQDRPAMPVPTHARADKLTPMFDTRQPWIGWYEAIADLIDGLPDSAFAPWQLERLPDVLRESVLFDSSNSGMRTYAKDPNAELIVRSATTPAITIRATGAQPRAFIVSNAATEYSDGLRAADELMLSVTTQHGGRLRAVLVNKSQDKYGDGMREEHEPAHTIQASAHGTRAAVHGRVVRMTPRCLARFQSFPDAYWLPEKTSLACEGIGNAVPPKLAQAIHEVGL